ncbi:MAG: copper homeostasis protein CutC [Lachnospiraceae bacterium]|nr:copper homeostasis protein CutC [Lachnospiraceae bacterium]
MNKPLIEACVDSYQSCVNAWKAGADRLELCAHLIIGGCTPSPVVFKQVMESCPGVKINVLIRPRFGDFLYTEDEMDAMCADIETFRDLGANGVVIGALTPDGELDIEKMKRMMACAGDMEVTLHRAFDMSRDPLKTLEEAIELGCTTILTSGQQSDVVAGKDCLKEVYAAAAGRIDIMAGCGVKKWNIQEVHDHTGIIVFHTTGRKGALDSGMKYRKSTVAMGLPTLSEYEIWQTDEQEFRECAEIVHAF